MLQRRQTGSSLCAAAYANQVNVAAVAAGDGGVNASRGCGGLATLRGRPTLISAAWRHGGGGHGFATLRGNGLPRP
jgi:pyruvate carboxylase